MNERTAGRGVKEYDVNESGWKSNNYYMWVVVEFERAYDRIGNSVATGKLLMLRKTQRVS